MNKSKISLLLLISFLFWAALTLTLHAVFQSNTLGADFYTRWIGGRALLQDGLNPYSHEVTLLSQQGIYGRPALPSEDQVAFAYPPYILLVMWPFLLVNFSWAQAGWFALNLLILSICLVYTFHKLPIWLPISFIFFYPPALGLILGNFSILIASIWLLLFRLLFISKSTPSRRDQWVIGALLAFSTIKPQLTAFLILFSLFYALRYRLKLVTISFLVTILLLLIFSWIIIPTWLTDWIQAISAYSQYTQTDQPLITLLKWIIPGIQIRQGLITAIILFPTLLSLILAFFNKFSWSPIFLWASAVTYLIHPNGMAYEQIIFYLPFAAWTFTHFRQQKTITVLIWAAACLLSWFCFALGRFVYYPFDVLPVLFFIIWAIIISSNRQNSSFFNEVAPQWTSNN